MAVNNQETFCSLNDNVEAYTKFTSVHLQALPGQQKAEALDIMCGPDGWLAGSLTDRDPPAPQHEARRHGA